MNAFENFAEVVELVKSNQAAFKRAAVTTDNIWNLDHYGVRIFETVTHRVNGKVFSREEKHEVDARWYANVISGCGFFNDRISRCYTIAGYIPYKLVARNPYSEDTETITREYSFC